MLLIEEIIQWTNGNIVQKGTKEKVEMVHFDAREIKENGLFIALTSGKTNGHLYINQAIQQGATVVIVSEKVERVAEHVSIISVQNTEKALQDLAREYRKTLKNPVIAVTGSNGKTTTKDMIASLLSTKLSVHKTKGNYNNHLGMPLTLLNASKKSEAIILEMGMNHKGEIDLLASIAKPDVGVITNIGDAHIEFFGTREKIAEAKAELLPHIHLNGYALLNQETDYLDILLASTKTPYVTYGEKGDVFAADVSIKENGTSFTLHIDQKEIDCLIPVFGNHNVLNALAACTIAYKMGLSEQEIQKGLAQLSITPMRFELLKGKNGAILINDAYNASPASMKASIETFSCLFPQRKKVVVLGDMFELGKNSATAHQEVGEFLEKNKENIDFLLTIGQDSKYISTFFSKSKCHVNTKEKAEVWIEQRLNKEHAFLFKASRGMKFEDLVNIAAE